MKILQRFSYRVIIILVSAFLLLNACNKKDLPRDNTGGSGGDSTGTSPQKVDSLKFYTWFYNISDSANNLPLYLWYKQVPQNFPWWSSKYDKAQDVLDGIASYAKVNGKKVDRYSFLDLAGTVSGELQGGVKGDFGFGFAPVLFQDNKIHLIVTYVYKGSPAGKAGIQRGWDITSVNGNTDIKWDGSQTYKDLIDGIYFSPHSTFVFEKLNGTDTTISLDTKTYDIHAILFDSIYTVKQEKVGYFVYNIFVNVANDENGARQDLSRVFNKFKAAGIKDLIVDLRYNGGGSVATAEYLDSLMAPASAVGQEMYQYKYNDMLTQYYEYWANQGDQDAKNAITPVKFNAPGGNLNLNKLFFIVGHGTASAAELTINNLKPYYQSNLKLIGDTTYGKPVGFFGIPISYVTDTAGYTQVATMYAINFRTVNKDGEGDYYSGMVPDYLYRGFNVGSWGDTATDARLDAALNYIKSGSFERSSTFERKAPSHNQLRVMQGHRRTDPHQFNGMVDYRKHPLLLQERKK